jgi:hypothetical protein
MRTSGSQTLLQGRKKRRQGDSRKLFVKKRDCFLLPSHNQHFANVNFVGSKKTVANGAVFFDQQNTSQECGLCDLPFFSLLYSPSPKPPSPREGGLMQQKNEFPKYFLKITETKNTLDVV